MNTILYNTTTNEPILPMREGRYLVDGQPAILPAHIIELTVNDTPVPAYTDKQNISSVWIADVTAKTYERLWTVTDKSEQQLIQEANDIAESRDNELSGATIKKALRLTISQLTGDELQEYASLFQHWKVGEALIVGDKRSYKDKLYEVIQQHTTQIDWTPDIVPALFKAVATPGVIPDWVQPTGAPDAYNIGDKVRHISKTWESTVNANVWEPGVYGWIEIT